MTHCRANRPRMVDVGAKARDGARGDCAGDRALSGERGARLARRRHAREEGPGPRHRDHRRHAGGKAHARTDSVLSSAGDRALRFRASSSSPRRELAIRCEVAVSHKTGVEMEALTGASRRRAHGLRHVQGAVARDRDRRCAPLEKSGGKRVCTQGQGACDELSRAVLRLAARCRPACDDGDRSIQPRPTPRALYARAARATRIRAGRRIACVSRSTATSRTWDRALRDGDEVVFLPPVSGG